MRLQWEAWPAEISESSLPVKIKLCKLCKLCVFCIFSRWSWTCPKTSRVGRGLVCLLALSVGRAIMWKAQFDRKPDSKGATWSNCSLFCLQKLHCYTLFGCLFQRWEHRQTLGKAFDRLHRWVLSMNSISSVCKHEMSCSLTCERFFWRLLPPGFFLSFCSLFLQVGVVAKRQQERLNSGRLAWLWAGDVTLWRTSRAFRRKPSTLLWSVCTVWVQCEYSVSTVWVQWTCLDILTV